MNVFGLVSFGPQKMYRDNRLLKSCDGHIIIHEYFSTLYFIIDMCCLNLFVTSKFSTQNRIQVVYTIGNL